MLTWWRNRNERWARANFTLVRRRLAQRNWQRLSRFGLVPTMLAAGVTMALVIVIAASFSYQFGGGRELPYITRSMYFAATAWIPLTFLVPAGCLIAALYYFVVSEVAQWPVCDEQTDNATSGCV
jgi:hypothetical protein